MCLPTFLEPESPRDGVDSGKITKKPSHSSLIFINTLVNNHNMRILIDTGATNTFINYKTFISLKHRPYLNQHSSTFVLADGIAPFHVLGVVELRIQFSNQITTISAHVAENLCTDVILGMDYIALYNLKFNIKKQIISIDINNRQVEMKIDKDVHTDFIPVTISDPVYLLPQSDRSVKVSTPISFISSQFIPHHQFSLCNTAFLPHKFLQFQNHVSQVTFSNISQQSSFVPRGTRIGYLCHYSIYKPTTNSIIDHHQPCGVTNALGESPDFHAFDSNTCMNNLIQDRLSCATVNNLHPSTKQHIHKLVSKISIKQQRDDLLHLLLPFHTLFDITNHNIANTPIHHVINTVPHSPPACKPYPQPDTAEIMYNMIQEFLSAGLMTESHSPYAAPAFLVKKHDGTYRFVVDYKKLNHITIKDSSPLPNMEDTIRKLGEGYKYFSKLDLKSGFYQIPIRHADKAKTAFTTPFGHFQFNVLPMGLKNSPPTFQKVMTNTLAPCRQFSIVYLDDIVVFSKTYDDHLEHLRQVFAALQTRNFVLNPPKCELLVSQINYLGHTISEKIITPMQDKIQAILNFDEPRLLSQANRFIGALSWYRKFLPNFATIAAPIHAVTNLTKKHRQNFYWKFAQSQAFKKLKEMLISAPLFLHYPIPDKPLILTTDASGIGIGGVLQQEVDGQLHNLYYHSQVLTPCEKRYSTIEKEALAIYKCFVRMRPFLLGREITIMTDHCPLCHIMTKTVNNSRVDRIATLIQEYNINKVVHIDGRQNCLPDYLSRYPRGQQDELFDIEYGLDTKSRSTAITSSTNNLLATMVLRSHNKKGQYETSHSSNNNNIELHNHAKSTSNSQHHTDSSRLTSTFSTNKFDITQLKDEQQRDRFIQKSVKDLQTNPHNTSFVIKDNTLYKLISPFRLSKIKIEVVCVPMSMINSLLQACHDDPMSGGHFSIDRTFNKLKKHYWWPNMKNSIKQYLKSCLLCQQFNISRQKKPGRLRSITPPEGPFQVIGIDYCGPLKRTPRENRYVLIITDYFTRHIVAVPLPNCSTETTAEALFNEYFCKFGVPGLIISDQGSHFRNELMSSMRTLIGYNHIFSTPYHPQTNGIVGRFNSTFIPQISKLQDSENNNWDEYLQAVVFAYNSGVHKTTNYSPYELLYGRPPRLPFYSKPSHFSFRQPNDYFEQLRKTLKIYNQSARFNIIQQQARSKTYYDQNRKDPIYSVGDRVLRRVHGIKSKLDPIFSPSPQVIIQSLHPVYIIRDEQTNIESRVHVGDLRRLIIN
uniref:RNA-directed DNA polymerase n=1 Tax=Philodina roseola TaxID=96448 RepID=A1YGR9_PHIRO|nr:putative pol protein [Philodina roseola]